MPIISKLEAAHRQIVTAIRLYFDDDDLAAVHTLACAAREIYERHCEAQGIERFIEQIVIASPDRTPKQLWGILNGARNFLKHPGASLDEKLELDDEMNAVVLWVACHDCAMLCKEKQPAEVQAYTMWFLATRFPRDSSDEEYAVRSEEILAAILAAYPALREASPSAQKAIGRKIVQDARRIVARAGDTATVQFESR